MRPYRRGLDRYHRRGGHRRKVEVDPRTFVAVLHKELDNPAAALHKGLEAVRVALHKLLGVDRVGRRKVQSCGEVAQEEVRSCVEEEDNLVHHAWVAFDHTGLALDRHRCSSYRRGHDCCPHPVAAAFRTQELEDQSSFRLDSSSFFHHSPR